METDTVANAEKGAGSKEDGEAGGEAGRAAGVEAGSETAGAAGVEERTGPEHLPAQVFEALRAGVAPSAGLARLAVGLDGVRAELERAIDQCADGVGAVRFLRGHYGCGKTFAARLAQELAEERDFVTAFVAISEANLHVHRDADLYRAITTSFRTSRCPTDALREILDRWVQVTSERLAASGGSGQEPGGWVSDASLVAALERDVKLRIGGGTDLPDDMQRAIEAYVHAVNTNDAWLGSAVLSWLAGSRSVDGASKRAARLSGVIEARDAMLYLRGLVEIARSAGHPGVVIVIDETETLLRARSDVREREWNAIRQLVDGAADLPGVLWLITGTPELFDGPRGFSALPPLHARVRFTTHAGEASVRQPQIPLDPLTSDHLREGARRLRQFFPARDPAHRDAVLDDAAIELLLAHMPNVDKAGAVPREFFRAWVEWLDLADTRPTWRPAPPPPSPEHKVIALPPDTSMEPMRVWPPGSGEG